MSCVTLLRWILLLVAAMTAASQPAAAAGVVGQPWKPCIARVGDLAPADAIVAPAQFDCTTPQSRFGAGNFYALSPLLALDGGRDYRARMGSLWGGDVALHVLYADGRLISIRTDNRGLSRHIEMGAIVEFAIPVRAAAPVRLMWEIGDSANLRGITVGTTVATAAESDRSEFALAALYGGFAGLCLALFVYNFALWVALRYPFQLAYCALTAALLAYAFSSSGTMAWVFDGIANNDRLRVNHLTLALAGVGGLWFGRAYFEPRVIGGWAGRMNALAIAALVATAVATAVFMPVAPRFWDLAYAGVFSGALLTLIVLVGHAIHSRSAFAWLFALAWSPPILASASRGLANFGLFGWSFWIDNSTLVAMAAEALLSSVAIALRLRSLMQERDDARAGETIARRLADTDPLTGLLNRRAFLEQAIGRADRHQLLIADLDHFKRVNETLGHDGGDEVLRVFARVLRQSVSETTLVARFGGEEFALLTPAETPLDPDAVLASLRATRMPFDLSVTASIGACTGPVATEIDWKNLYRGADGALFQAKSAGRDRARAATFGIAA